MGRRGHGHKHKHRHKRFGRRFFHRCSDTWVYIMVALLGAFFLALLYPLGLLLLLLGAIIACVVFVALQK